MTKRIFIFILLILFSVFLFSAIPLEQAIKNGIKKNTEYKNQLLEQKITELEKENAEKNRLFELSLKGSYLFKSEKMTLELPDMQSAPGIIIPGKEKTIGSRHNYDLNISLTQPIFTGNIIKNNIKIQKTKQSLSTSNKKMLENRITGNIKNSFFRYELLKKRKKSLEILLNDLELHLDKLKEFFKEDLIQKTDILETQLRIEETLMNIEDINKTISQEKVHFKELTSCSVTEVNPDYRERIYDKEESINFFKKNHPSMEILNKKIKMLEIQKKIEKGKYLPQIAAFAELHYGKPGINYFENEWSLYFQGGISLSFRVFDWNKLNNKISMNDYSIKKINNEKKQILDDIKEQLDKLYISKYTLEEKLKKLRKIIQITEEDSELKNQLYNEQQIDNIQYLSSLLKKDRYLSMKDELLAELELIKTSINTLISRR